MTRYILVFQGPNFGATAEKGQWRKEKLYGAWADIVGFVPEATDQVY